MRFALFLLSCLLIALPLKADEPLNTLQQEEVRKLVRDTLLKNPEILMEAMEILQRKQELARQNQQKEALRTLTSQNLIEGPVTPIGGNPEGDVTIVEFFDYLCGYCKRAFPGIMEVINSDKNVRYVFKEFAILRPESEIAARAALAAGMQGKYMEMHTAMMTIRGRLSEDKIFKTAENVGLDTAKLKTDMSSAPVNAEIQSTRELAQSLGISGTPAFIIGEQIIPGAVPPQVLREAIQNVRNNG